MQCIATTLGENWRHERAYAGHQTVLLALAAPDWTAHEATARCPAEAPHLTAECGGWNRVGVDWQGAAVKRDQSALSTDIGVSRIARHAGTSVPAKTVRNATPTAVAKVAGSLGATPKSNALIPRAAA